MNTVDHAYTMLGSCVISLSLHCYRTYGELKVVSNQHIVNTRTFPEHTLGTICWVVVASVRTDTFKNIQYRGPYTIIRIFRCRSFVSGVISEETANCGYPYANIGYPHNQRTKQTMWEIHLDPSLVTF